MSAPRATFAVVRSGACWRVLTPAESFRTFDFQVDAEETALKLADRARAAGCETEILLQDQFGELRPLDHG